MIGTTELRALRAWLVFLTLFEIPNLHGYLRGRQSLADGFFSTLKNAGAEKRVWSIVLALLCFARMQAAAYPESSGVMTHCAAVHVLEAVTFGYEYLRKGSQGSPVIYGIIVANAAWFTSAAMRITTLARG